MTWRRSPSQDGRLPEGEAREQQVLALGLQAFQDGGGPGDRSADAPRGGDAGRVVLPFEPQGGTFQRYVAPLESRRTVRQPRRRCLITGERYLFQACAIPSLHPRSGPVTRCWSQTSGDMRRSEIWKKETWPRVKAPRGHPAGAQRSGSFVRRDFEAMVLQKSPPDGSALTERPMPGASGGRSTGRLRPSCVRACRRRVRSGTRGRLPGPGRAGRAWSGSVTRRS